MAKARKRTLLTTMGAAVLMLAARGALAEAPLQSSPGLWAGIGLGYGYMQAASPAPSSAGGVWLELQLGAHFGQHWLAGFELGGLGTRISKDNYNPNDSGSSIFGQSFTHELLIVEYASRLNQGWFGGLGVGGLRYDNRERESLTFNRISGDGVAALCRLGYDWRTGTRTHVGVDLSYERGDVRLDAPLTGRFDISMLGTNFYVAYR
jgi:hypothetical protein